MRRATPFLALVCAFAFVPSGWGASAEAQAGHSVLYIATSSVPPRVRGTVHAVITSGGTLVSYDAYAEACAQANVRPSSGRAITEVATQQNADVIIIATYGGSYRQRTLRLRYFDGHTGALVSSRGFEVRGQHLRPAAQHQILRDIDRVAGGEAVESGEGTEGEAEDTSGEGAGAGLPPPEDWGDEGEGEAGAGGEGAESEAGDGGEGDGGGGDGGGEVPLSEQSQWGFSVSLGGGIGQRSSNVPTPFGGPTSFSTQPFFAIQAEALGYVRPDVNSVLRVALAVRYSTSIGMLVREERPGGNDLVTDLRAHHLSMGLRTDIPLAPGERPTILQLELGWQFRMLDLEMPSQFLPDYTLTGLYGRVGLWFAVGDSPISIGLIPEIGHAFNISSALSELGMVGDGFMVGGEAHIRLQVVHEVALQLMYREAHMFLGSGIPDQQMNDAERFVILRAEYRF
ncbi:MAG: hypothetical protein AB7S26_36620 [Sandaracinaceae bacterium]